MIKHAEDTEDGNKSPISLKPTSTAKLLHIAATQTMLASELHP
jgi:hypothetical protein